MPISEIITLEESSQGKNIVANGLKSAYCLTQGLCSLHISTSYRINYKMFSLRRIRAQLYTFGTIIIKNITD